MIKKEDIDIRWKALGRIDYLNGMDMSFLHKLKSTGLEFIFAGADSGSDRILKMMNKKITVKDTITSNKKMGNSGMIIRYSFVTGIPGETRRDLYASLELANKLLNDNQLAEINAFIPFETLYGAPLYFEAVKQGFKEPKTLEGWATNTSEEISRPWLSKKREKEIRRIYYLSRIIDGRAFIKYFKNKPIKLFLAKLYLNVAKFRWNHKLFEFAPEIDVIDYLNRHEKIK